MSKRVRHAVAQIAALEARTFLAATPLTIAGTGGADEIAIGIGKNGKLHVVVNGVTTQHKLNTVKNITVDAAGGNDYVWVRKQYGDLTKSVTLLGGNGNDTLIGGAGNDLLAGGRGTDALDGREGTNELVGGERSVQANTVAPSAVTSTPTAPVPTASTPVVVPGSASTGSVGFGDINSLAQNYGAYTGPTTNPLTSAQIAEAEADRRIVVVSDRYAISSYGNDGGRTLVNFTNVTDSHDIFSLGLVRRGIVVIAKQDAAVTTIGFDSRKLEVLLPTSGGAYVTGSSKRLRLQGNVTERSDGARTLDVIGGLINIPRDGSAASFVAA